MSLLDDEPIVTIIPEVIEEPPKEEKVKKKRKVRDKEATDYVNNKEYAQALTDWVLENKDNGKRINWTPMPKYIGECIVKIVDHFALQGCWRSYSYLDEMKSEARINLIKGIHNFNINISPNAFAYSSEIVRKSFIYILDKEKNQANIRTEHINRTSIYSTDKINLHDTEEE
jgi:predicted transcriptional regulator